MQLSDLDVAENSLSEEYISPYNEISGNQFLQGHLNVHATDHFDDLRKTVQRSLASRQREMP